LPSWFRREPRSALAIAAGDLEISRPWARSSVRTPSDVGGFFIVLNKGTAPDRLLAARSALAKAVEIQGIKVVGADIRMRPLDKGLGVDPGGTLTLKPRGYHLLLSGVKPPPAAGTEVPVTLSFERAGEVDIKLAVTAAGPVGAEILDEETHRG
jgi:copper(I)-binding protein